MSELNFRMKITPHGPFYQFSDKAIDLTKKRRRPKKSNAKRRGAKRR